ncbi:MAG: peptide chain release factor 1 [Holosporales bacterium]|jgi:peptide chain release factor 1|nr:peptide chain release factor 1 [Holosporales bacterium]
MSSAAFLEKLTRVIERFEAINGQLHSLEVLAPDLLAKLSKERSELSPVVEGITEFQRALKEQDDLKDLLLSPDLSSEMKDLAQEEAALLKDQIPQLENQLKILLLPKDEADCRNAIVEIRAGTGGSEAALFAASLLRMYERYGALRHWKTELLHLNETDLGGVKEASLSFEGKEVFARLKFESGVHRVQRVPETEGSGRVHTSTATVAVLPEAEEVDVVLEDKDLRIDIFRASGAGGQHVNKTESAIRITHLPTGLVVAQQDERSQHKNKARALKILRARLYELERHKKDQERAASRKGQVGTGDRSERIRTYNFPQGRVTDHRIGLTLYQIDQVMEGSLDSFVEALIAEDQAARLASLGEEE